MFSLTNFKSFKKAEIDLSKPFTILIGPNGSGKSNLIEGIELLSHIIKGYSLDEITDVGRERRLEIRGGLESCVRFNEKNCSLGVLSQDTDESYKITINFENQPVISNIQDLNQFTKYFNFSLIIFDPHPRLMRRYERIRNSSLFKDGSNLSAVLYSLHRGNEEQKKTLNRLLNLIKQIPEEPYENFDFITTQLDDVVFGLKHAGTGQLINAFILSDGTLRTLAVLTALETVAEGSLIIIEEFDNGLHPSRLDILVKAIDECSRRRKLNVLVTTHNPATLNALEPEQLDGVVFCTWNKEKQASELIKLKDLPRYDQLLERGRLGDLITRRIVDRYFNPDFEEEYKKKSLEWLRSIA